MDLHPLEKFSVVTHMRVAIVRVTTVDVTMLSSNNNRRHRTQNFSFYVDSIKINQNLKQIGIAAELSCYFLSTSGLAFVVSNKCRTLPEIIMRTFDFDAGIRAWGAPKISKNSLRLCVVKTRQFEVHFLLDFIFCSNSMFQFISFNLSLHTGLQCYILLTQRRENHRRSCSYNKITGF